MAINESNRHISGGNAGWIFTTGVAALQVLAGSMLLIFSGPESFESDTGVLWAEITRAYPTVANQFTMAQQASLFGTLGIGAFALMISLHAFRKGERWAWFVMWILPLSMIPGALSLLRAENQAGPGIFGLLLAFFAATGIALSAPKTFSHSSNS